MKVSLAAIPKPGSGDDPSHSSENAVEAPAQTLSLICTQRLIPTGWKGPPKYTPPKCNGSWNYGSLWGRNNTSPHKPRARNAPRSSNQRKPLSIVTTG